MTDGSVKIYKREDITPPGGLPVCTWSVIGEEYYTERTVGYNRLYTAMQNSERIDMLIRIPRRYDVDTSCTVTLEPFTHVDEDRYRVAQIQQTDSDGLPFTDLSLERLVDIDA